MKKIFSLIAAFILLSGCDDGDMTFKTFDFSGISTNNCELQDKILYYKINTSSFEALILELAPGTLKNKSTLDTVTNKDVPVEITINATNKITYRNYTGNPVNICNVPSSVSIRDEWIGEGTLSVITREKKNTDGKITGYTHQITLKNISFSNGGETIVTNNNIFGTIDFDLGFTFDFKTGDPGQTKVDICSLNNLIFTLKGKEIVQLSIANFTDTFQNIDGNTKEVVLGGFNNANNVKFTVFDGNLTKDRICEVGGNAPITPNPVQQWLATQGKIVVNTRLEAGKYIHTIRLKDVIFSNISSSDTFNLDDIAIVDANGYLFGEYKP